MYIGRQDGERVEHELGRSAGRRRRFGVLRMWWRQGQAHWPLPERDIRRRVQFVGGESGRVQHGTGRERRGHRWEGVRGGQGGGQLLRGDVRRLRDSKLKQFGKSHRSSHHGQVRGCCRFRDFAHWAATLPRSEEILRRLPC